MHGVTGGPARELTPAGVGGVAVLAVDGGPARERLAALAGGALPAPGTARFARLVRGRGTGGEELLDEALVVARAGGALEVHVHGGRATIAAVRGALAGDGASVTDASQGDAGGATLEDRLRALAARAPTSLGAQLVLAQAEDGRLRSALEALLAAPPPVAAARAADLVEAARRHAPLLRPSAVALTGPVNAGKSTLLNALAGADVALVSDEEGTTRDSVAAEVTTPGGWPLLVIDTAGARELPGGDARGEVERAGQELGRRVAERADLVLALAPAGRPPGPDADPRARPLRTRSAEAFGGDPARWPAGHVSALEDPVHAAAVVGALVEDALELVDLAPLRAALARGDAPTVPAGESLVGALAGIAASRGTAHLDSLRALL